MSAITELQREIRRRSASPLSPRETEVLAGVAAGRTTDAIAVWLGSSFYTVKTQRERAILKLGAPNTEAAVAIAMRNGWLA